MQKYVDGVLVDFTTDLPTQSSGDDASNTTKDLYDRILRETKTRAFFIMLFTISEPLVAVSRIPFIFLFIQSFASSVTTGQISVLLFAASMWASITNITMTGCGDKIGHDKMYLVCTLFAFIGLSIQAISTSFGVFALGEFLYRVPNKSITFAYLASVLPHKFAVRYCGILYTGLSVIYLLAPIVGALIAQFLNYRAIFIFNAALHIPLLFVCFFSLNGSIKYLEHKQNLCGIIDGLDKDDQFPICIRNAKQKPQTAEPETKKNGNENILTQYFSFWRSLPVYDLWMLLCSIMINNMLWCTEALVIYYFLLFLINIYNASILYGILMFVEFAVIFGVTTLIVPLIFKRIIPTHIWVMTLCSAIGAFVCVFCTSKINHILEMHWLYNVGIACSFSVVAMVSEMCVLELQPEKHSGKVTGLKDGLKDLSRAVALVFVGSYWKEPYNALWFALVVVSMISFFLSIVMMMMVKYHKVPKQSTNDDTVKEPDETKA